MTTNRIIWFFLGVLAFALLSGCSPTAEEIPARTPAIETHSDPIIATHTQTEEMTEAPTDTPFKETEAVEAEATTTPVVEKPKPSSQADVIEVSVRGEPGAYSFSVQVSSPDEGCSQYADWWEVVSQEGELLYRRILLHSHVGEQPFTRSGGPVPIEPDRIVLVRAHMHPGGYGGLAMKGSPEEGFEQIELSPDFASNLLQTQPLPAGCNF